MFQYVIHTVLACLLFSNLAYPQSAQKPQSTSSEVKHVKLDIKDSLITAKIAAKFTKDPDLNPLKIFVSTENGIVTLKGNVKNKQAYVRALRIAKETKGVKQVKIHQLHVKEVNTAFTDAYITAKVEAAILHAKVFYDESIPLVGINATTTNGIVKLSGRVKSKKSADIVVKRVYAVKNVKRVINQLAITTE